MGRAWLACGWRPVWRAVIPVAGITLLLGPFAGSATTLGSATVGVNRISGNPASQEIVIPAGATTFETPAANLAASLGLPNEPPSLRAEARAVAGIDLPAGAFYGTISTFANLEAPGTTSRASARSFVQYEETFQVLSDSLPDGTLVDVQFDLLLRHRGSLGASGIGACCSIRSVYEFAVEGNMTPYDSYYAYLPRTGSFGILAGGIDDEPIELRFGPYSAPAFVGGGFFLGFSFEIESLAVASAQFDPDDQRYKPGRSEAAGSAAVFLATEVTPAASGFAAARAPAGSAYLFSPGGGFTLPGIEAFDPANLDAHWLQPVVLPEPSTAILVALGLAGLAARRRSG